MARARKSKREKTDPGTERRATYFVRGMHCPACERILERTLLGFPSLSAVEVSRAEGKLTVTAKKGENPPSAEEINAVVGDEGYLLSPEPFRGGAAREWLTAGAAIAVTVTAFFLLERSGLFHQVLVDSSSTLATFFLFGILAGLSSCAALVGGLVLSLSETWQSEERLHRNPHLRFNLGRLLAYGSVGALLGTFGGAFRLSDSLATGLTFAVALIMALLALQMLGLPGVERISLGRIGPRKAQAKGKGRPWPFLLGASTVLLPCGFSLSVQGLALLSGSALRGGLMMTAFAAGTMPSLLAIGLSASRLQAAPRWRPLFLKAAGALVLVASLYTANSQLNVLGLPSLSDIGTARSLPQSHPVAARDTTEAVQTVRLAAGARSYTPNVIQVKAGIPVRLEVVDAGFSGCTNAIMARGLFEGTLPLVRGGTAVAEFVAHQPGRYKFSCWMGMVSGIIDVVL